MILVSDGGSRGNPGPSACAFGLYGPETSSWIYKRSMYLGHHTNNYAEYHGLLYNLISIWNSNLKVIEIISDSELLVNHVTGKYQCKSPDLQPLLHQIHHILQSFTYTIQHVPREHTLIQEMDKEYNILISTIKINEIP